VFLLRILDLLSKIKSKGNDGTILILLDVVSFVAYIIDYYMYQVDLNLNKRAYFVGLLSFYEYIFCTSL